MADIDHITTRELVVELMGRCDIIVLAFDPKSNKESEVHLVHRGSIHEKIGLARMLQLQIEDTIEHNPLDDPH